MEKSMYDEVYARFLTSQDGFIGFQNKKRERVVKNVYIIIYKMRKYLIFKGVYYDAK